MLLGGIRLTCAAAAAAAEEDRLGSYAAAVLSYFLAEGVAAGHILLNVDAEADPSAALQVQPPYRVVGRCWDGG